MQTSNTKPHKGKIIDYLKNRYGKIYGYRIQENDEKYIAHLGDVNSTEELLYDIRDHKSPTTLELETFSVGEIVDFEPFGEIASTKHAIHVKKHTQ